MADRTERPGTGGTARTLPINVLLKGRLCLLLGAGHVAHRKCASLLDHGARVVLVSPRVGPHIARLEETGRVEVRVGRYHPGLLDELAPFLVFAATNDDETNRAIARDAASRGILVSSVSSWREGDFISPSRIPWGKGQVSVSTEGASCRQAKFMRLRLSELLGGERELLVMGVDMQSLTLEEFEAVRPDPARVEELTALLRHLAALEEFALLATCNRLELYAWCRRDEGLLRAARVILGLQAVEDRVFVKTGEEVIEHAANVAAGHLSQVVCETQITGQFKAAFQRSFALNVAGVHLQNLHDGALNLAKRIRALAGAGEEGLPELVARVIRQRFPGKNPRVLVLGAGGLGCEVANRVSTMPGVTLAWANRTLSRLPEAPGCERLDLPEALRRMGEFDVAVTVLGAREPVIRPEHLPGAGDAPLILDLGLPRNVDREVSEGGLAEVLDLGSFRIADVDRGRLLSLAHTVTRG